MNPLYPNREPSRALTRYTKYGTPTSAGEYDKILLGHSAALAGYMSMRMRFANIVPRIEAVEDETPDELIFRLRCERALFNLVYDGQTTQGFQNVLERLADTIVYGASVYEAHWVDVEGDIRLQLNPIQLSHIAEWLDDNGSPSPVQYNSASYKTNTIPADSTIRVAVLDEFGPDGVGILRPLVFLFETWKTTLMDNSIRSIRETGGLIINKPATESDAQAAAVMDAASAFATGEAEVLALPEGFEAKVADLPAATNKLPFLEYFDQAIRSAFNDSLDSLISSDKGSRALGDAITQQADKDQITALEYCVRRLGTEVFAFIARTLDYQYRLPSLTAKHEAAESISDRVRILSQAAPLTGWTDSDREALRQALGMLPTETAGPALNLSPSAFYFARKEVVDILDAPGLTSGRDKDEAALAARIGVIAKELRAKATESIRRNGQYNRIKLENEYKKRIQAVIEEYVILRHDKAVKYAPNILSKATARPADGSTPNTVSALEFTSSELDRAELLAEEQASIIVSRVLSELDNQVGGLGKEGLAAALTIGTRITEQGLSSGAASVGHIAEQAGRLEGTIQALASSDMYLDGVYRVSFQDSHRCDHCVDLSGEYYSNEEIPSLPDPLCKGGVEGCRCFLMPVFRKRG